MSDRPKPPQKYRAFLDFEYLERGGRFPIVPISMGLRRRELDTGRAQTLYLEFLLSRSQQAAVAAHPWLCANVLPQLTMVEFVTRAEAVRRIIEFLELDQYAISELWTWYGAFDLVLFLGLFGSFGELHPHLPMMTMDLKQWQMQAKMPASMQPSQPPDQHHAGADCEWNEKMYDALRAFTQQPA